MVELMRNTQTAFGYTYFWSFNMWVSHRDIINLYVTNIGTEPMVKWMH